MTFQEFITELTGLLTSLAPTDRARLEEYYRELYLDKREQGLNEEEIVKDFGTPEEAAKRLLSEYSSHKMFEDSLPASTEPQNEDEYRSESPIQTIQVEAQNLKIEIVPVSNGPVRVLFEPRKNRDRVQFSVNNGVFCFRHKMPPFSFLPFLPLFRTLILEVPTDFPGDLYVKTSNSSMQAAGLTHLSTCRLQTSNSKILVEDFCCKNMTVTSSNGGLNVKRLAGDSLALTTSNSLIHALDCAFMDYIQLRTCNASVHADNITSRNISIHTSNAGVTGTIRGDVRDFAITSRTSNASNNLSNINWPGQEKRLDVHTSNGRIQIHFPDGIKTP